MTRRGPGRCRLTPPVDAEAGRGLMLVASLSTDWGYYRTPAGKAVYFTLALETDAEDGDEIDLERDPVDRR